MATIVDFEPPQPNSAEMVNFLHGVIVNTCNFTSDQVSFTTGDLMGAMLFLMVETGLNTVSPQQLREDIIGALDKTLEHIAASKSGLN